MPNDPEVIPPAPEDPPEPEPRAARRSCEFCGCHLAEDGGVLRRGKRAKELLEAEERAERAEKELANLRKSLDILEGKEKARTEAATQPKKRGFLL